MCTICLKNFVQSYAFSTKLARKICGLKNIYYICNNINVKKTKTMNKRSFLYRVFDLYYDGFRNMTLGRTLWAVILIKLFIMFAILKVFFFPDFLKQHAPEGAEAEYVANEMLNR